MVSLSSTFSRSLVIFLFFSWHDFFFFEDWDGFEEEHFYWKRIVSAFLIVPVHLAAFCGILALCRLSTKPYRSKEQRASAPHPCAVSWQTECVKSERDAVCGVTLSLWNAAGWRADIQGAMIVCWLGKRLPGAKHPTGTSRCAGGL